MAGASSEEDTKEISDDDGDEEGQLKSRHIQEIKELRGWSHSSYHVITIQY